MFSKSIFYTIILAAIFVSCSNTDIKENQVIAFDNLAPFNLSAGSTVLHAKASSGLQVSYRSSDTTIASVRDSVVLFRKPGTVDITATQSGNDLWYAAANVVRTLVINEDNNANKTGQVITFNLPDTVWRVRQGTLSLTATSTSGLPVSFSSSNTAYASISGNQLTVESSAIVGGDFGVYVVVTASQAGNYLFNAAPTVSRTIRVIHDVH